LEDRMVPTANVDVVGSYEPHPFGFGTFTKGVKPSDHALKP
jgi:hypothetical protein